MENKHRYRVIGLMSGTSLDGVDIACCVFRRKSKKWEYKIEKSISVSYSSDWTKKLSNAHQQSSSELLHLHVEYGRYLGNLVKKFNRIYAIKSVDFIASHGHTIFHQPEKSFTFQLGDGNMIHAVSQLPVVYNFRSLDVALGGQGAPLVPVGDHFLFDAYDVCLNLGGIANLSYLASGKRSAFDICFANMGLNYLAQKKGKPFDKQGAMASDGNLNIKLLNDLGKVYSKTRSKRPSLKREFFEAHIQALLDQDAIPLVDRLHTFSESVAVEISKAIPKAKKKQRILCTGGGAFNPYLLYRLLEYTDAVADLVVPDPTIVKFKEALVFAFLGVLRVRNEVNCLSSVTGAERDSSGGVLVGF